MKENYSIQIFGKEENHKVIFKCEGYVSFLRALETFYQLFEKNYTLYKLPLEIQDEPSYKWRG